MTQTSHHLSSSPPRVIALTLWVYRGLLYLHPSTFRRAFSISIVQVFHATCLDAYRHQGMRGVMRLWIPEGRDVVWGAIAEYAALFVTVPKGAALMVYRRSANIIFGAAMAFVFAGSGFAKMSEAVMKSSLPASHTVFSIAYAVVMVGASLGVLAIRVGGVPLAYAAWRFAGKERRRDLLLRFAVPPLSLLLLLGAVMLVVSTHSGGNTTATSHTLPRILTVGTLLALFIAGALASTAAVLNVIAQRAITESVLRFTVVPGLGVVIAMLMMLGGAIGWAIGLWQTALVRFWGTEGILGTSTLLAIVVHLVLMVVASVVTTRVLVGSVAAWRSSGPHLA